MGGFFGAACSRECNEDIFFGTDYHSHLGTSRGGMAMFSPKTGFNRSIHNIEAAPFRTKFGKELAELSGTSGIGVISDTDPQPIIIRSHLGTYAISTVGVITNMDDLVRKFLNDGKGHSFAAMGGAGVSPTELCACLINQQESFAEGIRYAQSMIEGSMSILILTQDGDVIAARDAVGRHPVILGRSESGTCVSFEDFAFRKLGYRLLRELGPGEVVSLNAYGAQTLVPPGSKMRVCAFLWTYYGYPTSVYEGRNVETVRNRNGAVMARNDLENGELPEVDSVSGVPDSGVAHAIGYSNESRIGYARPFIKYTPTWPRSFMPANQTQRNEVARMKLVPVHELITDRRLLFVDDSIVRGTQLRETVSFLYDNGAAQVHMRSACPPIMFGCKYLNFSRSTSDMELLARKTIDEIEGKQGFERIDEYSSAKTERGNEMRCRICRKLRLTSLGFQTVDGFIEALGLPRENVCTYCWDGRE